MKQRIVASTLLALCVACAAPPVVPVGAEAEVTPDGLYRVKNSRLELAWVKRDVNLSSYDSFVLDPVRVTYKHREGDYELSLEDLEKLSAETSRVFRAALTATDAPYSLVDAPRPGALRVSASILDLKINVPERTAGRGNTYGYEPAQMILFVELHDAMSGEILARGADRAQARSIGTRYDVVTAKGEMQLALERWARILREGMDDLHRGGIPAAP